MRTQDPKFQADFHHLPLVKLAKTLLTPYSYRENFSNPIVWFFAYYGLAKLSYPATQVQIVLEPVSESRFMCFHFRYQEFELREVEAGHYVSLFLNFRPSCSRLIAGL